MIQTLRKKQSAIFCVICLMILCSCGRQPMQSALIVPVISEPVATVEVTPEPTPIPEPQGVITSLAPPIESVPIQEIEVVEDIPDKTKPIYEVYKYGQPVKGATAELQWIVHDMCVEYDLPEKMIFGLIVCESTFCPTAKSGEAQIKCYGLAQINKFWITGANITHFTDDYRDRDLCDPYDNMLTLAEMMYYARDTYQLDLTTEEGQIKYLYWHNTGCDPRWVSKWSYATTVLGFANELVTLQS